MTSSEARITRVVCLSLLVAGALWPEPASAERAESGEPPLIRVSSPEPGAEVTVDGYPCGRTPALIEVAPGRHEVVVVQGSRRTRAVVNAAPNEVVEVMLERAAPEPERAAPEVIPSPFERPGPGPMVPQARDNEMVDEPEPRAEPVEPRAQPVEPERPWVRRIRRFPWFETSIEGGMFWRTFDMGIDASLDPQDRDMIRLSSDTVGLFAFRLAAFPIAGSRVDGVRGLGVEFAVATVAGMEVVNQSTGVVVDSDSYELDLGVLYRYTFGSERSRTSILARLGWHRTDFYLGDEGNDIVPPFTYDSVRIGLGLHQALGTPHLIFELQAAYLAITGVGGEAARAYNEEGSEPEADGAEVRVGLVGRVGILELSLVWVGRWMVSEFNGRGNGWGVYPTTSRDYGGRGIESTGPAHDSYQQLRFGLGIRL